jgi:hypothetical protein
MSKPVLEPTQPPIQWVPEALLLVPRSKNAWNYTSTPQYVFIAWCSVKETQGQLYLSPLPLDMVEDILLPYLFPTMFI